MRAGLLVAGILLATVLVPAPAASAVTLSLGTYAGSAFRTEFRVGESITFQLNVTATAETFSVTRTVHLYRSGSWVTSIGDGSSYAVSPGTTHKVTVAWASTGQTAGKWEARWPTPYGWAIRAFDLGWAPDLTVHRVLVENQPLPLVYHPSLHPLVRDGTNKLVRGCVGDVGTEPVGQAEVGLYFRTPVDPLLVGTSVPGVASTPDWRNAHLVATKTVSFTWPNKLCRDTPHNIDADGWYVEFTYNARDFASPGSLAQSRIGLRADPAARVWELSEANDREVESTVQPLTWLP